jgi:hypothetical protein
MGEEKKPGESQKELDTADTEVIALAQVFLQSACSGSVLTPNTCFRHCSLLQANQRSALHTGKPAFC